MADTKEIKDKFKEYLSGQWKANKTLQQCVDRFGLRMFDVFLLWIRKYKKWTLTDKNSIFSQIVSPGLKYLLDNNFWDMYFKPKTYAKYKALFMSFMDFCKTNKEYIDWILSHDEWKKLENTLEWKYWMFEKKEFIKTRHNFIKNDEWENGDKFRKFLNEIYAELSSKQIKLLYELFFKAYEKCSKENYKNKKREKGKKINVFDTVVFPKLSDELSKINISWNILEKIKSIFWKYLNFVPIYRNSIKDTLNENIWEWSDIQDETKRNIIDCVRNPKWANYDIIDWEVVAPLDNYWIFPEENYVIWEEEVESEHTIKKENNDHKAEIDDPNQDELYKFDPDKENWYNR